MANAKNYCTCGAELDARGYCTRMQTPGHDRPADPEVGREREIRAVDWSRVTPVMRPDEYPLFLTDPDRDT